VPALRLYMTSNFPSLASSIRLSHNPTAYRLLASFRIRWCRRRLIYADCRE
jgi:hypothetical protein